MCTHVRVHKLGRGAERGRERIPSRLHIASVEPNAGLELTNHEIMTWAKINSWMLNRLSHPGTPSNTYFILVYTKLHWSEHLSIHLCFYICMCLWRCLKWCSPHVNNTVEGFRVFFFLFCTYFWMTKHSVMDCIVSLKIHMFKSQPPWWLHLEMEVTEVKCGHKGGTLIQLEWCLYMKRKRHQRALSTLEKRKGHVRT